MIYHPTSEQLAILRQCAEEESSIIELAQELRTSDCDGLQLRSLVRAVLNLAVQAAEVEFFLDMFESNTLHKIDVDTALGLLELETTWDMRNDTQLHLRRLGD